MSQEELKEKMEKIKNAIESDYTKNVDNVKYLGEINIEDELKQIFLVIEQELDENGDAVNEYSNCYTEDGELLGRYVEYLDSIVMLEEFRDEYQQLNKLNINGIIDLKEIEKEQLEQIAKALGIKEDEIKSMSSMDLAQKIEQKQDAKENSQEDEQTLNEEETKIISNGKQEIKLGVRVDEYRTLGKALDLNESEYSKVAIVYSERLQEIQGEGEPINNTTYSFVAIKKDGTAEVINDRLKVDERTGNNSLKESIKIDANERAREDNKTKTRFQIIGKNGENEGKSDLEKETLSVEMGQYGEIKAYYGKGRSKENENIETQLETTNVRPTSRELREVQSERKGMHKDSNDKSAKEAKANLENGKDDISMYSADGDENTIVLADYVEHNKEEIVAKIMQNEVIANSQFGEKDIEEKLERVTEDENEQTYTQEEIEQKLEEIEKEIEEDAGNFPTRYR